MRHSKVLSLVPTRIIPFFALAAAAAAQQAAFVKIEFPATASAMKEDGQGALWIGSEEGLFRFDGSRFRQVDIGLGDKEHIIRSLARSEDGAIWATSLGGLFRIQVNNGEFQVTKQREGFGIGVDIQGPFVAHVEGDGNGGSLAVGVYRDGKLNMFRYDSLRFEGPPRFAADGSLIGACGDAVCEIDASAVAKAAQGTLPIPKRFDMPVKGFGRRSTLKDASGCYWFRSHFRTGYRCPTDREFHLLPLDEAEVTQFESLVLGPRNDIWLVNDAGQLTYGRPGGFRTITPAAGMPRMVECLFHASDGSIWMGTLGALWRLIPPDQLELWSERNGISLQGMVIRRGGDGSLLLAGSSGLLKLDKSRDRWEPFGDQKEMRYVRDLLPTPAGTTLVASAYGGVLELDAAGKILRRANGNVVRLEPEDQSRVWTSGLRTQLLRFGATGLRFEPGPRTLEAQSASDFARDEQGRLWHCTQQGLSRLDPGAVNWRSWTSKDGLLHAACRSITVSPSGDEVWMIYQTDAMSKLDFSQSDAPRVTNYEGNAEAHYAFFIRHDRRGWIWRGGEGLHVAARGRTEPSQWLKLDAVDGFPASDIEVNRFIWIDSDNSVWLLSPQSVHHFRPPPDLLDKRATPRVFLSGAPAREMRSDQTAAFEFGSLYFERRNQLRFRYRFHAGEPWIETKATSVSQNGLAPGDYRFELSARVLPSGEWTPSVSHEFSVVAPVWRRPAVWGAMGIGVLAMLGAFTWIRVRERMAYRKHKQAFLEAIENNGQSDDPDVTRLLVLSKTPTHVPDLSPWRDDGDLDREIPTHIGDRFSVESVIASGGFATVYFCRDRTQVGAHCAVKVFFLGESEREWMLGRFAQEIESLKRIDHPNVVRFLDAGETQNREPYLAMDFVEGETLRSRLMRGPLSREETAELTSHLGAALGAIHQAGVLHRDIKPENLMLTPSGRLVVIDFSIAIAKDPRSTQYALSRAAGSFDYMAPEQVVGFAARGTDIYAFALVVFEMLTGERVGNLLLGSATGLRETEVKQALAKRFPNLPPADILAEALILEVRNRPEDAVHFAERLAAWLRS